jgi:hypothetical protein
MNRICVSFYWLIGFSPASRFGTVKIDNVRKKISAEGRSTDFTDYADLQQVRAQLVANFLDTGQIRRRGDRDYQPFELRI